MNRQAVREDKAAPSPDYDGISLSLIARLLDLVPEPDPDDPGRGTWRERRKATFDTAGPGGDP